MTSKIVVNNIEADAGISSVTLVSNIAGEDSTQNISGINSVTANTFHGSGANLTALNGSNIASGTVPTARLGSGTASSSTFLRGDSTFATVTSTTINNNANNRIITGSGTANTLEGEANFTYDGSLLTTQKRMVIGNGTDFQIPSRSGTSSYTPQLQVTGAWNDPTHGATMALNGRTDYPLLWLNSGASFQDNSGSGYIVFSIKDGAGNYCNTSAIRSRVDGTVGNNTSPGALIFQTASAGTCQNSDRMVIDSGGRVTKPDTPFVMVHINTQTNRNSTSGYLTIPWDTIHGRSTSSNVGSHFNTSNHRFTAPVAGRYFFCMSLNIVGDNIVKHRINGADVSKAEYRITDNVWDHADASFIYDMNKNDYYDVVSSLTGTGYRWNAGGTGNEGWDTLSIYLLG